jgi:hypothetical protein
MWVEELTSKQKNAEAALSSAIQRLYEEIILPIPDREGANPLKLEGIDLQSHLNTSQKWQERILEALKNQVFDSITVNKLVSLAGLSQEKPYVQGKELVSYFFKFPDYPKLLSGGAVKTAILQGIEQGRLGYVPSLTIPPTGMPTLENVKPISYRQAIPPDELDLEGYLITPQLVEAVQAQVAQPDDMVIIPSVESEDRDTIDPVGVVVTTIDKASPPSEPVIIEQKGNSSISRSILTSIKDGKQPAITYRLESVIDKAHLFDVIQALQTLSDQADNMSISIKVTATKKDGFDINWLRNAIEEPLDEQEIKASSKIE